MSVWRLKVTDRNYRKEYRLSCKGSLKEGYQKVQHFAMQKEQEYLKSTGRHPHVSVISCSYAFKPVGEKEFHGQLWCPYCRKWQFFFQRESYEVCAGCGMSKEDFWIRKYNHLDFHMLRRAR